MRNVERNLHWLLILLGFVFISSCSEDPTGPDQPTTVISEETVVIDEDSGISIVSIDSSLIVYDASQGDPANLPIADGDILVSVEDGGYLRRVAAIEVNGDSVLVQTDEAVLAEVILEGGISWSGPLEFDLSQSQKIGEVGFVHPALRVDNEGGNRDISFTLDGLGINLGADAELGIQEGSFRFAPQLDIDGEFDHGLQEFHAIASGDLDFDILGELVYSATGGVHGEIELISDLPASAPIHIQAGWVPIVIYPEFDLLLGAEASASGTVTLNGGVETDNHIEAGFRWTETDGFETVYEKSFNGEVYPLEVSTQIGHELRIYLKPRLSFMVYTVAGPYIALEPYTRENGTVYLPPQSEYCTAWSLGIAGEVGANLEILDWGFSAGLDLADWSIALDEDCEPLGGGSDCSIAPTTLDFGEVEIDGEHQDLTFSISNIGDEMLTGEVTAECDDFIVVEGSGYYVLNPGESKQVTVRFDPSSEGTKTCTIQTGASCLGVYCSGEGTTFYDCYPDLSDPQLEIEGTEDYEANGQQWTRYLLDVVNWADFPDVLFEPAPDLPPCGENPNAARSWVRIYEANGSYIYGFCALGSASSLRDIWFSVPQGEAPPEQIYIEIWDRRCDITYTSNLASISYETQVMDQHQEGHNYGFWFEQDVRRWQEFAPTLDNLSRIDLLVLRWGYPGDVRVAVTDTEDVVLYQGVIREEDIPHHEPYDYGSDWVTHDLSSALSLTPGQKYRIRVWAELPSPTVDNRYFWSGHTDSGYDCCWSDVDPAGSGHWDGYDYSFRTFGYTRR